MKAKLLLGLALGAASFTQTANADDLQNTRNVLDQWVETNQLISKEQSDWKLEQSILSDTQTLLSNELERLNQAIQELEDTATTATEDRAKLTAEKDELEAGSAVVLSQIGALETQMKAIVKTLPLPLVEKLKPLIRRLPDNPEDTKLSMGERVQNIVGILSQTDKFNTTLTITSESREISQGKIVQVTTIYWGLAMAYYVDDSGNYAGIGVPSAEGWDWPEVAGAGPQIKQLIDIYEGLEPEFVPVPARIN
ncbi:MAG: DUF3450 family protein [Coraliomargarita sp.]